MNVMNRVGNSPPDQTQALKEDPTLGKFFGFLACTTVVAASVWMAHYGRSESKLAAGEETYGQQPVDDSQLRREAGAYRRSVGPYYEPEATDDLPTARNFLRFANRAADRGDLATARRLAETAARFNVRWDAGEETPARFLRKLDSIRVPRGRMDDTVDPYGHRYGQTAGRDDRPSSRTALRGQSPESPFAAIATSGKSGIAQAGHAVPAGDDDIAKYSPDKRQAVELVQEAMDLLKERRYADARLKALQAKKMNVRWYQFETTPEFVLARIETQSQTMTFTPDRAKVAGGAKMDVDSIREADRRNAQRWLSEARKDIRLGQLDDAKAKVAKVKQLELTYDRTDDTPELVLDEVRKIEAAKSQFATGKPAPPTPSTAGPIPLTKDQLLARQLLLDAQAAAKAGNYAEARRKVAEAETLSVPYGPFQLQPDVVLEDIDRLSGVSRVAKTAPKQPAGGNPFATGEPADVEVITPSRLSAAAYMQQGVAHMRKNDNEAAHQAFLQADRLSDQLSPLQRRNLDELIRSTSPRRAGNVTQVGGTGKGPNGIAGPSKLSPLQKLDRKQRIKYEQMRNETLNAIFKAERLQKRDPKKAVEIIDRAMGAVETSDLPKAAAGTLLKQLRNSRSQIDSYLKTRAPLIAQDEANRQIKAEINRDIKHQINVDQQFAKLVEEFNKLFKQRRYAEAEIVAKQARELNRENPIAETLFWKSRYARRIASNQELVLDKEGAWWEAMDEVEQAAKPFHGNPMQFPKDWKKLSDRRKGKYGADNRVRTEEEKRIERSLSRQISLHFHGSKLAEVVKHIATTADINVVLDNLGLEDEAVSTDTPVTIDVDGIMLKSALNLILKPLNLDYTIEDEVLKITSKMRQQGQLHIRTYPVADLVVPIPNFTMDSGVLGAGGQTRKNLGMQSVPSGIGGYQHGSGGQFQVNDPMGGNGGRIGNGGLEASVSGSRSALDFDTLTELITQTVEPESWQEIGGSGTVRSFETTLSLVIRQTQKVHDEIADLLSQLRRLQDLQVTIEVRFIVVSERFFERIGIDFDFDVQDNVGPKRDPAGVGFGTITSLSPPAQQQQQQGQQQQGQQQQGQQQQQGGGGGIFFNPPPTRNLPDLDKYRGSGSIVGLSAPDSFTGDLDVQFRQGSFDIGVPDFGNFNPDAGIQFGLAILSDIEAFFFIQAAQGDERSNLLFAPKVTLFNGQIATVADNVVRPFVTSLIPTVGFFSVGFTPQITPLTEGVTMTVQAVVSADRRFVRLAVAPFFTNITDVFTFSFLSGGGGIQGGVQGQGQQGVAGGIGGGLGGGGLGGFGGGLGGGGIGGIGGLGGLGGIGGAGGFSVDDTPGGNPMIGFGGIGGGHMSRSLLRLSLPQQIGGGLGGFGGQGGQGLQGQQQQGVQQQGQAGAGQNITVQQPVQEVVSVSTVVSVPDGGTVLLGGIKRLKEGRNMAGVPILNKIPYISRLFKNTGVGRETESLMLMVTPRIIIQEEEEELLGIPL
jgi:type II secretory pathway component GspD/PulD (secretin)/tetratricopeptide (TPR) repeat protein